MEAPFRAPDTPHLRAKTRIQPVGPPRGREGLWRGCNRVGNDSQTKYTGRMEIHPVNYEHLDDLAACGVRLRLPETCALPLDLSGAVLSIEAFKTLHEKSSTILSNARIFIHQRAALLKAVPQWHPYLSENLLEQHVSVEAVHSFTLNALAKAEEVWPDNDSPSL